MGDWGRVPVTAPVQGNSPALPPPPPRLGVPPAVSHLEVSIAYIRAAYTRAEPQPPERPKGGKRSTDHRGTDVQVAPIISGVLHVLGLPLMGEGCIAGGSPDRQSLLSCQRGGLWEVLLVVWEALK